MGKLTTLTMLSLANNKLKGTWEYFPISKLSGLVELRLTGNMLSNPPVGVARLPKLEKFDWRPISKVWL